MGTDFSQRSKEKFIDEIHLKMFCMYQWYVILLGEVVHVGKETIIQISNFGISKILQI